MKILVTGSSGRIGRYVVQDLKANGHEVAGVDVLPSVETGLRVDLTQSGEIYQALANFGAEAVVHMGAWANPGVVPDTRTYGENVQGTFNVLQACADLGIRRIVSASSNQVYGFAGAAPLYVPVDEDHPHRPVNCYALSKVAGEETADYFVHNFGLEVLSFRFMGVRRPAEIGPEIDHMVGDPNSGSRILWTRTDARDAALACRLAAEAETVEPGPYNITGTRVVLDQAPEDLIRARWETPVEIREPLPDYRCPLSCEKANRVFGYQPRYVWSVSQRHPED